MIQTVKSCPKCRLKRSIINEMAFILQQKVFSYVMSGGCLDEGWVFSCVMSGLPYGVMLNCLFNLVVGVGMTQLLAVVF